MRYRYGTAFDAVTAILARASSDVDILDVEDAFREAMGYTMDRVVLRVLVKRIKGGA